MMMNLLMIIIFWAARFLPGDYFLVRGKFMPIPVWAGCGPHRGQCRSMSAPGVGWMTMRLDPVLRVRVLSWPALARGALAACPWSMPREGA